MLMNDQFKCDSASDEKTPGALIDLSGVLFLAFPFFPLEIEMLPPNCDRWAVPPTLPPPPLALQSPPPLAFASGSTHAVRRGKGVISQEYLTLTLLRDYIV